MMRRYLRFLLLAVVCCANLSYIWGACSETLRGSTFILILNNEEVPDAEPPVDSYKGSLRVEVRQTEARPLELSIIQNAQLSDGEVALRLSPLMDYLISFIKRPKELAFLAPGVLKIVQNLGFNDAPLIAFGIDLAGASRDTIFFRSLSGIKFQLTQNLESLQKHQSFYRVHARELTDITFWLGDEVKIFGKTKLNHGDLQDHNL